MPNLIYKTDKKQPVSKKPFTRPPLFKIVKDVLVSAYSIAVSPRVRFHTHAIAFNCCIHNKRRTLRYSVYRVGLKKYLTTLPDNSKISRETLKEVVEEMKKRVDK